MRLRKQILTISLVTLALPWVGCQGVREMDKALRQGQAQALEASAQAAAARIRSEDTLSSEFHRIDPALSLYSHALVSDIILDGYSDDWLSQNLSPHPLSSDPRIEVALANNQENLFAYIQLQQNEIRYFNPTNNSLNGVTRVHLGTGEKTFAIYAAGPGQASIVELESPQERASQKREYSVKAIWMEREDGFQLEISLPLGWAQLGLSISLVSQDDQAQPPPAKHQLVLTSDRIEDELEVFASDSLKLSALNSHRHFLASAGQMGFKQSHDNEHGLLTWLFSLALGNRHFPQLPGIEADGTVAANTSDSGEYWFVLGNRPVTRIHVPLISENQEAIGYIVAEQSTQALADSASVFSRVLVYSFLASTFAAFSLVIYASWLSIRIRKLSQAASNAISESGKIEEHFPVFESKDEVGDLSRNYAQLLSRLREYTNYLRTLSSKLSHELRTPLAIVRTSLDNLEHEELNDSAKVYAERAREGASRLSNILNSMSAASRVEQAIDASEREIIPCDDLLSHLKAAYEDVYPHVRFELRIRKDGKGLKINGSGELLVQALDKLVDNAADFCPNDGLIEIGLYRHQNDIIITIHNEGPPLPKHMHGQLFDSMVSLREQNNTEDNHHLGLGLYIVRLITDFHNGEVQGYNVPDNSGVIFEIRLPAA